MLQYISKHLGSAFINIAVIVALVFVLLNVLPSDPARVRLGVRYNEKSAEVIRRQYGLDRPLIVQFGVYCWNLIRGDIGTSILTGERIAASLRERLPRSLLLISLSLLFSLPMGLWGISAAFHESKLARAGEKLLFGLSVIPIFVLGVAAVFIASAWLKISLIANEPGLRAFAYYLLPALLLSAYPAFVLFKIVKDTLREALQKPYVLAHRAFGFSEKAVIRYAWRNCAVSVLGVTTNLAAYYLSSIYVIEFVFSLGGFGAWAINSAQNYDLPVVMATVIVSAVIYNAVNIFTAVLAPWFDKRIVLN